jgi:hypothetical protein
MTHTPDQDLSESTAFQTTEQAICGLAEAVGLIASRCWSSLGTEEAMLVNEVCRQIVDQFDG